MTAASGTAVKGNQSSTWGSQNSIAITQPPPALSRPGRLSAPGRPRQGRTPGAGNAGQAHGLVLDPATRSHEPAAIRESTTSEAATPRPKSTTSQRNPRSFPLDPGPPLQG